MREIQTSRGDTILIDDEDYDRINQFRWHYHKGYARTERQHLGKITRTYMHRLILGVANNFEADHINGNKLDNQKANLRIVNHQQNSFNRPNHRDSVSQYKGVYWHSHSKKWRARIRPNGHHFSLGLYKNECDAALAYNQAAIKYFGEYARLNEVSV